MKSVTYSDVETAIRSYMPSWAQEWLFNHLDEHAVYSGIVARRAASKTANAEAVVEQCYLAHQRLLEALPVRQRSRALRVKLAAAVERGDLARVPTLRLCQRVVHRIAQKGG
jgi:hypothetical protein